MIKKLLLLMCLYSSYSYSCFNLCPLLSRMFGLSNTVQNTQFDDEHYLYAGDSSDEECDVLPEELDTLIKEEIATIIRENRSDKEAMQQKLFDLYIVCMFKMSPDRLKVLFPFIIMEDKKVQ